MKNTDLLRFPNKERLLSSSINPNDNLPIYIEDDQVSRLINLATEHRQELINLNHMPTKTVRR
jgi:hypothetical protein